MKGFHWWEQTRLWIAQLHHHIADRRLDFLHQLSTILTVENQVVVLEDWHGRGMLKNRRLSKALSQQGWGLFRGWCEGKAERCPRARRVINGWEATGQYCLKCGWYWGKLNLSTCVVTCDNCGAVHDRKVGMGQALCATGGDATGSKTDVEIVCAAGQSPVRPLSSED